MNLISSYDYLLAAPEILVLSMACIILMVDLFLKDNQRYISYALTQFTLIATLYLTINMDITGSHIAFHKAFVMDPMAQLLKVFIFVIAIAVFAYSREYLQARELHKGEYYVLGLFAILGMMIMVSAYSFLTMYLGLELLSLALYAMIAFQRDSSVATESAMKYFVLGALASGMLLYGISIVYGLTGTLNIIEAGQRLSEIGLQSIPVLFGLSFIIVGLAFKFGAVPFHMWLPDVYQGSPTAVTLFIGTAPKLAAFAMIMRILVEGMGSLHGSWQDMLIVLVVLSVAIGNVVAIAQTNIKRMLAYSTISHVGFILMGILAGTTDGYAAALFYTIVYAIMALGAFGIIILLSRAGHEAENLDDFKGLNQRSPWFAFVMLIIMFSMAGVPPLVGFHAKLAVLRSIIQVDLLWLAVVGVIFSVIGAFYYLRVIKLMYFDEPQDKAVLDKQLGMRTILSLNGIAILILGFYPSALLMVCNLVLIR